MGGEGGMWGIGVSRGKGGIGGIGVGGGKGGIGVSGGKGEEVVTSHIKL